MIVEPRPDGPAEEAQVVEILKTAGVKLLSADDIEQTVVEFRPWDGRFPASVFVVLFGDTDVPWWHAQQTIACQFTGKGGQLRSAALFVT